MLILNDYFHLIDDILLLGYAPRPGIVYHLYVLIHLLGVYARFFFLLPLNLVIAYIVCLRLSHSVVRILVVVRIAAAGVDAHLGDEIIHDVCPRRGRRPKWRRACRRRGHGCWWCRCRRRE